MLKILKASAGSGKTYHLAKEYIRLLVEKPSDDAYKHVLAVTFTNKATEEMKSRILRELHTLSKDPSKSKYTKDLLKECNISVRDLQERAQVQLSGILHDYSSFAVSTIDRFFQQTLRAFSREIGQLGSYQVQLDREALQQESVDRVLDSIDESSTALIHWLTEGAREDLAQKGHFSIENKLEEMAKSLKTLPEGCSMPDHDSLRAISKACKEVMDSFETDAQNAAAAIEEVLKKQGIAPKDSNSRWLTGIYKPTEKPTPAFFANAMDSSRWFARTKDNLRLRLEGHLEEPLRVYTDLFGKRYNDYVTAKTIWGQIYSLGVADSLRTAFIEVQKEKNVISIDDSNTILKNIIDGSDAPFIYEKLGVRFKDFLLDEFQDTAKVQWDNFLPLLKDSESINGESLVVGDVKQSIYRWRGSDWELLGSGIERQFPNAGTQPLDGNWRTCREIVEFNNEFFEFAAAKLDRTLGLDNDISGIYSGVRQAVCTHYPSPGSVEAVFVPSGDQPAEVVASVRDLNGQGADWSQIAVLVRNNADGSTIASALLEAGIPVVSDDSLKVKSSITVRRLISQMSLADSPASDNEKQKAAGFLATEMGLSAPDHYHSLPELAEVLLRDLKSADPNTFEAEIPYINSFMDYLRDWASSEGNNLPSFLKDWDQADPVISSPASGDAVRILTVHKSKGLEFPFVIFPYAEKVTLYKASSYWCTPNLEGSSLQGKAEGIYNVELSSGKADSAFAQRLQEEQKLQAVDNINIFYVALTRAKFGLKIISANPSKEFVEAVKKQREPECRNMSQILWLFVHGGPYFRGERYIPAPEKESEESTVLTGYPSFPADSGGRLSFSQEAADYFGEDGSFGMEASNRIRGNVLHDILSCILVQEDIPGAVRESVLDGNLPAHMQAETQEFLQERVASVAGRGWFSKDARVFMEVPIIDTDGREWRPDRVVVHPSGEVSIIDYKFGEAEDKYARQVQRYVNLYRRMGYSKVSGYLWYLSDNSVVNTLT